MPALVVGPMLRYADATAVTVFVETDQACTVEIAGRSAATFQVAGHHFALVVVDGLQPGSASPYRVRLDGREVWPEPGDRRPASRLRTLPADGPRRIAAGSCRVDRPHEPPWNLPSTKDRRGVGQDALRALALRLVDSDDASWPDLLLFVGDQVYGDEGLSPALGRRIRARRAEADAQVNRDAPPDEVGDFEEYTWLYAEAWADPDTRWLLSTVPSAMIFDDHDVRDDWNISQRWLTDIRNCSWWSERIEGALMAYWVYQHLGNLSPGDLEQDELLRAVRAAPDGADVLRAAMRRADTEIDGRKAFRWSYSRTVGRTRLVVVDSRSGRILADRHRAMLDADEFAWVERELAGDPAHLIVVSSLPVLLVPSLHYLEAASEALCAGLRGRVVARVCERIRQRLDLEHWAAFRQSFDRLLRALLAAGSGRPATGSGADAAPPGDIVLVSGDVHFSYVAELSDPALGCRIRQVTTSPIRNALSPRRQRMARLASSPRVAAIARILARRLAAVPDPPARWAITAGPSFGNTLLFLDLGEDEVRFRVETVREDAPVLQP